MSTLNLVRHLSPGSRAFPMKHAVFLGGVISLFATLLDPQPSRAADKHWNAIGQGRWSEADKWTLPGPPGGADNAFIGSLPGVENETVFMDQDVTVANLVLTDGMGLQTSIHCCGEVVIGEKLTVLGVTSIGIDSRLVVYESGPGIDFESDTLNILDNFALIQGSEVQIGSELNVSADGQFRGTGLVQFAGNGTTLINDGALSHGPGSVTYTQLNGGSFDLDGVSGAGLVSVGSAGGMHPDAHLTFNGGGLTDAFSGEMRFGSNARLDMSVGPWIADANSLIDVFGFFGDNRLTGDEVTLAGEVDVSGSADFLIEADAVLASTANVNMGNNAYVAFDGFSSTAVQGGSITLGLDSELEFNGDTTLSGGTFNTHSNLSVDGAVRFNGATTWDGDVTINGIAMQWGDAAVSGATVITAGVLDMDGGGGTAWNINNSLVANVGSVDSSLSNTFDGVMNVGGGFAGNGLTVNLTGAFDEWTMAGEMNLTGMGIAAFPLNRVDGSPMRVTGELNVEHRVRIAADTTFANGSVTTFDDASAAVQMTGDTLVAAGATFNGPGTLANGTTGEMTLASGASLDQVGLVNRGLLEIGDSPGIASVNRFENQSDGVWSVDIGGYLAGAEHDLLLVGGGEAQLDGAIEVDLIDAGAGLFLPQLGDEFTILTALGGVSGQFDNSPVSLAGGMQFHWSVIYNPFDVRLRLDEIAVPEPGTALLAIVAAASGAVRRRGRLFKAGNLHISS